MISFMEWQVDISLVFGTVGNQFCEAGGNLQDGCYVELRLASVLPLNDFC